MQKCLCLLLLLLLFPHTGAAVDTQDVLIHVELDAKRLTLYHGSEKKLVLPIADGAADTPTPMGTFTVHRKFKTELSGFGTRFIGFRVPWGQYGIHGTNQPHTLGSSASHGCIRLSVRDAERLYPLVPVGAHVWIDGGPYGTLGNRLPTLKPGMRSGHVYEVQRRLHLLGLYSGTPDGIYGIGTSRAVVQARTRFSLQPIDLVDGALYQALGMMLFE